MPVLSMTAVASLGQQLETAVGRVVVGRQTTVRQVLTALLARRHVLLEDVPGTGKTTLVKTLARACGASSARLQCTPDLLPSDITGFNAYDPVQGVFRFREGPVFHHLLLVDEINRASPKTQAALLECMEEGQVSVDGVTYPLPVPFLVLATQNPVEYEGTFPLPEAQLDRFGLKLQMGYPSSSEEMALVERFIADDPLPALEPVCGMADIQEAQQACRRVYISDPVKEYAVTICAETRKHPGVALGASPRATLAMLALAQAWAALAGREYVLPDDVKEIAPAALPHRIQLSSTARWRQQTAEAVVRASLNVVPAPTGAALRRA